MEIIILSLQNAMLIFPLALAIYLSYHIMKITDLSVEAGFLLGAVVFSKLLVDFQINQYLCLVIALMSGALFGTIVSLISKLTKMDSLIISILVIFMMYSINFQILGKPNLSLLSNSSNLQEFFKIENNKLFIPILIISTFSILFLNSKIGLIFKAYGSNQNLLKKLNYSPMLINMLGLAISNCLASFSGIITAINNGYADINMAMGIALVAIGTVSIGRQIANKFKENSYIEIICCYLGVVVYFLVFNLFLYLNIDPINIKLFVGLFLLCSLASTSRSKRNA